MTHLIVDFASVGLFVAGIIALALHQHAALDVEVAA